MKKLLVLIAVAVFIGPRFAMAGGHGHHGGHTGPAGPAGQDGADGVDGADGSNGTDGLNGLNGLNGVNGAAGVDGKDAETHTRVIGGVDVRLLDYQYMALHLFNDYNLRDGRNDSVGVRVAFKVGQSYEEREMAKLKALCDSLATSLSVELAQRDKQIKELRSVAHRPGVHQEHFYREYEGYIYPLEPVKE